MRVVIQFNEHHDWASALEESKDQEILQSGYN